MSNTEPTPVQEPTPTPVDEGNPTPEPVAPTEPTPNDDEPPKVEPEVDPEPKHVAPESADAYEIGIDGFDLDSFKDANPEAFNKFHEAGLSNEQATVVLGLWEEHNQVQIDALQEEWGGEFENNLRFAQQAVKAAGMSDADLDSPTMAVKLAAFYGKQLQEDMPPAQNAQQSGAESIRDLMGSEAYMDEKHPDHKATFEKVQKFYAKNYVD